MLESLLRQIGVNDQIRAHLDQATLEVQRPLALWLGLAVAAPIAWYVYRRQREALSTVGPRLRWTLTATRVSILLLLIIVLAAPALKLDLKIEKRPLLAILFDQSQSMALPVGPLSEEELLQTAGALGLPSEGGKVEPATKATITQMSRAQLANKAVAHQAQNWLKPLADKYELRYYSLGEGLKRLPIEGEAYEPPAFEPQAAETRIGDSVAQLLDEAAGRQVAGVVLFSDGENTAGRAPAEAARAAADAGAPIFAVPTGSESPIRDVSVVDVFAPDLVSSGDTVQISATLEVQGYPEQPVKVMLFENEGGGEKSSGALIDSKDIVLRNTEQQHVELTFKAREAGARLLTVRVQPAAELPEDLPDNNSDSVAVRVSAEKLRVLYIEGLPRWDFRFLKNAMRRDHGLGGWGVGAEKRPMVKLAKPGVEEGTNEPDLVLEAEVRRLPIERQHVLPATVDELARYHTVILGDVSPQLVGSRFVELLIEAVRERGVGLVVEAGPQSMPHRYSQEFQDLLPVKLKPGAAGIEAPAFKPFRFEVGPEGAIHETLRLYDDVGRSQEVWEAMPPFHWCAAAERASPAATVLAYNSGVEGRYGKLPLAAHQFAGQGKVLFLGIDSTFLWRENAGDRFFYKFWGQAIRFVARRNEDDLKKKSWLEVRPMRARPGETAEIELMAYDAEGSPRTEGALSLRVEQGGGESSLEMTADKLTPGRYLGQFTAEVAGDYRFVFEPGESLDAVAAPLHVSPSTAELRRPNVNVSALSQLGKLVKLDQLRSISDQLAGEPKLVSLHSEASIWDNWLMLCLLAFIYSLDVGLRRLAGLS